MEVTKEDVVRLVVGAGAEQDPREGAQLATIEEDLTPKKKPKLRHNPSQQPSQQQISKPQQMMMNGEYAPPT